MILYYYILLIYIMDSINFSTNASIIIQIISAIGLKGVFINLP